MADFGAPMWINSSHLKRINAQLIEAMRIITGTVKSMPTQWLLVLSNIMPCHIRKNESLARTIKNVKRIKTHYCTKYYKKSHHPDTNKETYMVNVKNVISSNFCGIVTWKKE